MILGAILSIVLGVALAAVYLVLKPVTTAKELPKEPVAGVVYYLSGSQDSSRTQKAIGKQNVFAQGRSIDFSEEDLNALVAPPTPATLAKDKPPAAPASGVTAGPPNFRIRKGELQIAAPIHISALSLEFDVIVQARGRFARSGDTFVFSPSEVYVGSCPVQRLPSVSGYALGKILASKTLPEGALAAWRKLADVQVDGSTVRLTMP